MTKICEDYAQTLGGHTYISFGQFCGFCILYPDFNRSNSLSTGIPGYGEPPETVSSVHVQSVLVKLLAKRSIDDYFFPLTTASVTKKNEWRFRGGATLVDNFSEIPSTCFTSDEDLVLLLTTEVFTFLRKCDALKVNGQRKLRI